MASNINNEQGQGAEALIGRESREQQFVDPRDIYTRDNPFDLIGAIGVIPETSPILLGQIRVPAKWNNNPVGMCMPLMNRVGSGQSGVTCCIPLDTFQNMERCGFSVDPRNLGGITDVISLSEGMGYRNWTSGYARIISVPAMRLIAEQLARGTPETYRRLLDALIGYGIQETNAINIMRLSFATSIPKFAAYWTKKQDMQNYAPMEPADNWAGLKEAARYISVDQHQPRLMTLKEEFEFAIILSVHANAKEFNTENYADSMEKRMKAYYYQKGYTFTDITRKFLTVIFPASTMPSYHDFIPKYLRRGLLRAIMTSDTTTENWKTYLLTLMEWNGMSMIRETRKLLVEDTPKTFLVIEDYVSQIQDFMEWYRTTSNHYGDNFKYLWYIDPNSLEAVTQARFAKLFSVTLKAIQAKGLMRNYKSGILNPAGIPDSHILDDPDVINVAGGARGNLVTDAYLAMLNKRRVSNRALQPGQQIDAGYLDALIRQYGIRQRPLEGNPEVPIPPNRNEQHGENHVNQQPYDITNEDSD